MLCQSSSAPTIIALPQSLRVRQQFVFLLLLSCHQYFQKVQLQTLSLVLTNLNCYLRGESRSLDYKRIKKRDAQFNLQL